MRALHVYGGDLFATSRQGLVSLVSVDEDSLGENLEVIWQLEPGARVLDRAGLPAISGCDDAARLESFLDAVRWGACYEHPMTASASSPAGLGGAGNAAQKATASACVTGS